MWMHRVQNTEGFEGYTTVPPPPLLPPPFPGGSGVSCFLRVGPEEVHLLLTLTLVSFAAGPYGFSKPQRQWLRASPVLHPLVPIFCHFGSSF